MPVRLPLVCLAIAVLSAIVVRAMIGVAVLDTPGHRSAHDRPIPKGGGVGVMVAFGAGLPIALRVQGIALSPAAIALLLGAGLLALVSWLDDVRQFRPLVKLLAQAGAAAVVLCGLGPLAGAPRLDLAVGFGWLLFVTNAVNFIDGLNGLAAGSMALACLMLGLAGPAGLLQAGCLVLAAGLAGFLPFNYPNARIFLGDVGSQGAGLMVAAFGLLRWQQATPWAALAMPLLLLGILYDVGFTLCRRLLAGERLAEAHRGHLYQLAYRSLMPGRWIAVVHWGFVLWGGTIAGALAGSRISLVPALLLAALPQVGWTVHVLRIARRSVSDRW